MHRLVVDRVHLRVPRPVLHRVLDLVPARELALAPLQVLPQARLPVLLPVPLQLLNLNRKPSRLLEPMLLRVRLTHIRRALQFRRMGHGVQPIL
jgi:hypothetical protein